MPKFRITVEGARLQPVTFTVSLRPGVGPGHRPPPAVWREVECVVRGCVNLQQAAMRKYQRLYNLPDSEAIYKVHGRYGREENGTDLAYVDALEVTARDEDAARDWWQQYCKSTGRRDREQNEQAVFEVLE